MPDREREMLHRGFRDSLADLDGVPESADRYTGRENLIWMCRQGLEELDALPLDKLGRWMGFVTGCLVAGGYLPVLTGLARCAAEPCRTPASGNSSGTRQATATMLHRYAPHVADLGGNESRFLEGLRIDALVSIDIRSLASLSAELGLLQGHLAVQGKIDVGEERHFSRPIFHAGYAQDGIAAPAPRARRV